MKLTKLNNGVENSMNIDGTEFEYVNEFICVGTILTNINKMSKETEA